MFVGAFQFTGTVHVDSRWHTENLSQILHFWKRPWVKIYWFFCQYLTPGVIWGLYVHLRDTPDATRPFLVDITPSRVVFSAILVPRDPCDNSEMCIRTRSLVTRLLSQIRFLTPDATRDPCKWTNTVSETGIKPSCVGNGEKLISVDRKASTTMVIVFPTLWLRILRIFFIPDTWLLQPYTGAPERPKRHQQGGRQDTPGVNTLAS